MASVKKEQIIVIAAIVIVALLGVNAYLMYANKQKSDTIEQKETALSDMDALKAELDREYNLALEQLEAQKSDNEELNQIIEQQKEELKAQRAKVQRSIASGNELGKARKQIQDLVAQRDGFLAKIKELSEDKEKLQAETERLATEKANLETTLTEVQTVAKEKEEVLTKEKEELSTEKEKLSEKVARGSVLSARNISVVPLKVRNSGKEVDTKYASKVEALKICFDLDENAITPSGNNKVLIRILTPLGETLYVESQGSGEFANQTEGGSVSRFTTSKGFTYNNKSMNVCMDWSVQTPLTKGSYTAEVYNKGYKVGASTFSLK